MAYTPRKRITGTMPFRHHPDDAQWIDEQLSIFPPADRAVTCAAYGNMYADAEQGEAVPHKKAGVARKLCNDRLRVVAGNRRRKVNLIK